MGLASCIELMVVLLLISKPSVPLQLLRFKSVQNRFLGLRGKCVEFLRWRQFYLRCREENVDLRVLRRNPANTGWRRNALRILSFARQPLNVQIQVGPIARLCE